MALDKPLQDETCPCPPPLAISVQGQRVARAGHLFTKETLVTDETKDPYAWMQPFIGRPSANPRVIVHGGYAYATDGRIAVRCKAEGQLDTVLNPEDGIAPTKLAEVFRPVPDDAPPWPDSAPITGRIDCPDCEKNTKPCTTCDGTGSWQCDTCGDENDCRDCHGRGRKGHCPTCQNSGLVDGLAFQKIGVNTIAYKYDQMIRALPNVRVGEAAFITPIPFRFDGGEGVVMGMNRDPE